MPAEARGTRSSEARATGCLEPSETIVGNRTRAFSEQCERITVEPPFSHLSFVFMEDILVFCISTFQSRQKKKRFFFAFLLLFSPFF